MRYPRLSRTWFVGGNILFHLHSARINALGTLVDQEPALIADPLHLRFDCYNAASALYMLSHLLPHLASCSAAQSAPRAVCHWIPLGRCDNYTSGADAGRAPKRLNLVFVCASPGVDLEPTWVSPLE